MPGSERAYARQHGSPPPRTITAHELGRIRRLLRDLATRWHALKPREAMELPFTVD